MSNQTDDHQPVEASDAALSESVLENVSGGHGGGGGTGKIDFDESNAEVLPPGWNRDTSNPG
jgi:hypothetical protein